MRREQVLSTAGLEARVKKQNAQILKLRGLAAGYDETHWKKVTATLQTRLRNIERAREDSFLKMTEVELKVSIAREIEIKELMELPMTVQTLLAQAVEENAAAKEQLRKFKQRTSL